MKKILYFLFIIVFLTLFCACMFKKSINIFYYDGVLVVKLPVDMEILPHSVKSLETNYDVFLKNDLLMSVNAGYFDSVNQKTTSFVIINKDIIENPLKNENLMNNPELKPYMDLILNRSEFRVLNCNNKIKYDIANHFSAVQNNCEILHSVQAGPMIYPEMTAQKEYFIVKNNKNEIIRDVIRITKKLPRTVLAIKDNQIYFFIATLKSPKTIVEMKNICHAFNVDKALNLDGGGSTSFNYDDIFIVSDKNNLPRKLKSFLIVKKH